MTLSFQKKMKIDIDLNGQIKVDIDLNGQIKIPGNSIFLNISIYIKYLLIYYNLIDENYNKPFTINIHRLSIKLFQNAIFPYNL